MATQNKPAPTGATCYNFNASELMPSSLSGGAVLHVHNYLLTKLLMESLKSSSDFSAAHFTITGDSPSTLSTTNTFGFHGSKLTKLTLTTNNGHLCLAMSLHKKNASPGIDVNIDINMSVTIAAAENGNIQLHPGHVDVHKKVHKAWWATVVSLAVPVTAIVEAIVKGSIPDVSHMLSGNISQIKVPIQFPTLKIDIGHYGSLELGLSTSFLS